PGNGGRVMVGLDRTGRRLTVRDTTTGGNPFEITGTNGADAAAALGIAGTHESGVAAGANLPLAYLGQSTLLSSLNHGAGIGTGKFESVDGHGRTRRINGG